MNKMKFNILWKNGKISNISAPPQLLEILRGEIKNIPENIKSKIDELFKDCQAKLEIKLWRGGYIAHAKKFKPAGEK